MASAQVHDTARGLAGTAEEASQKTTAVAAASEQATTEAEAAQQRALDYDVVLTWEALDQWLGRIEAAELTAT